MKIQSLLIPMLGLAALSAAPLAASALPMAHNHGSVYSRLHNERVRVREGARTHELSHKEAVRLNRRVAKVQRSAARDRYMHGGHLTWAERARLNTRLNKSSKMIYNHKHDIGTH